MALRRRGVSRRLRRGARVGRDHRRQAAAAAAAARRARRPGPGEGARWLRRSSGRRCSATARRRSPTRRCEPSRAATWGVRLGWLAQTALLAAQAAHADAFPWSSWAGSLNLFVWLVVGAYLIWGCRPRYRLLGLAVMPLAALLFVVARIGGGTDAGSGRALRQPLPRAPRRPRPGSVRRLHARSRAGGPLPLAGAPAEESRGRHPPVAAPAAAVARAARAADDRGLAAAADARPRDRGRASAP